MKRKALEFILVASEEFKKDMLSGMCSKEAYAWWKWGNLNFIIEDPEEFHRKEQALKRGEIYLPGAGDSKNKKNGDKQAKVSNVVYQDVNVKKEGSIFKRGFLCLKENGLRYTIKRIFYKIRRRFGKR